MHKNMMGLAVKPVDHATHLDEFWAGPNNREKILRKIFTCQGFSSEFYL